MPRGMENMTAASIAATLSVEAGWAEAAPVCRLRGGPAAAAQLGHQSISQTKVAALSEIAAKPEQIVILSMDIATNLDRRLKIPPQKELNGGLPKRGVSYLTCQI